MDLPDGAAETSGTDNLQECIAKLVRAEQRVNAFTTSVNELKSRWETGDLDDSTDIVEILEHDLQLEEENALDEAHLWEHEFMAAFADQMKELTNGFSASTSTGKEKKSFNGEVGSSGASSNCPATEEGNNDPVKVNDKVCSHSYEGSDNTTQMKQFADNSKTSISPFRDADTAIVVDQSENQNSLRTDLEK